MLEITAIKFLLSLLAVAAVVILVIVGLRGRMRRIGRNLLTSSPVTQKAYMKQYAEVNVFKYAPTFLRLGMVISLLLVLFAFNWTTYEKPVHIPEMLDEGEVIELETPPRSPLPPPPPPPPPPPVIEEVPEEEVVEEIEFEDMSIEPEEIVEPPAPPLPPPAKKIVLPPTPPPPPPPVIDEGEEKPGDDIFIRVAQMPRFKGCADVDDSSAKTCSDRNMLTYIYRHINYPTIARENGIEGRVIMGFVIEKDGTVSNVQIIRDIGGGCGKEALRVINSMPKWTPGYQRTEPVRVQFNIPIRFELQN